MQEREIIDSILSHLCRGRKKHPKALFKISTALNIINNVITILNDEPSVLDIKLDTNRSHDSDDCPDSDSHTNEKPNANDEVILSKFSPQNEKLKNDVSDQVDKNNIIYENDKADENCFNSNNEENINNSHQQNHFINNDKCNEFDDDGCVINTNENSSLIIVGDIHGNIDSLIRIFSKHGYPTEQKYLFLGDYVDRGSYSCEVIILLYSLKVLFPNHIFMIRGNHEYAEMTEIYGFKDECMKRSSLEFYDAIINSFQYLPIAAIIGEQTFCVHGGISPRINSRNDILSLNKGGTIIPAKSLLVEDDIIMDFLWSDPCPDLYYFEDSPRGCGKNFGEAAANEFMYNCNFIQVIRAHQTFLEGYNWAFGRNAGVLTIFSCCDYCETMNDSAVAILEKDNNIKIDTIPPLSFRQKKKKRIIFPNWILSEEKQNIKLKIDNIPEFHLDLPKLILV